MYLERINGNSNVRRIDSFADDAAEMMRYEHRPEQASGRFNRLGLGSVDHWPLYRRAYQKSREAVTYMRAIVVKKVEKALIVGSTHDIDRFSIA
jgi:hypothetical protein